MLHTQLHRPNEIRFGHKIVLHEALGVFAWWFIWVPYVPPFQIRVSTTDFTRI